MARFDWLDWWFFLEKSRVAEVQAERLLLIRVIIYIQGFPCGSAGKESTCNVGDLGLIPGLGRSPGEGKGSPLLSSGLENFMDCIVRGVAKSRTQLSYFHFTSLHYNIQHPHFNCNFRQMVSIFLIELYPKYHIWYVIRHICVMLINIFHCLSEIQIS